MLTHIDHIAIAVVSLDHAIERFSSLPGFTLLGRKAAPDHGVNLAIFQIGDVKIELLEPADGAGSVGRFLKKRGEGLHHIAFRSDSMEQDMTAVASRGCELINRTPVRGELGDQIAFLSPKSLCGVLIEFCGGSQTGPE